jgi:glycosyltransferase involved in cell wall biosynthesis
MQACDSFKPDHILALWALPSGAWAKKAGKRYAIPYSTWALGSDIWSLGKIPVIRQYLGHVMRQAKHRFADGIQLSGDVTDISGRDCTFLPSSRSFAPPLSRQLSSVPPYRLAFLGRWHTNKGIDILLEVLETLAPEDWKNISAIRIHGGGPLEADVTRRCQRLREAGFPLEIGGYLDLQGARELFEWTDFIIIPSRIESIPVVFSDAMQAGRPVIASPVGDLPHLIRTYGCGLLSQHANASALLTAIRKSLTTTPQKFGEGIKLAAAEFSIGTTAQHFLDVIA